MKVVILMENSTCRDTVACAHGLSMYIETDKHKILFDMGPDAQFIDNAKALGVDLTQVDIAFLSHAHNDHCGGLEAFLKLNDRAKVYMQKAVWGQYYVVTPSKCAYIGMDAVLKNYEDRFVLCDGVQKLDEELTVFSAVPGRELWSGANDTLREKIGEDYPRDTFRHEQDLIGHGKRQDRAVRGLRALRHREYPEKRRGRARQSARRGVCGLPPL